MFPVTGDSPSGSFTFLGIADLDVEQAKSNLANVHWQAERYSAISPDEAFRNGTTHVGDDYEVLMRHTAIEIIIEATGNPIVAR